jgi:hypothetical protein
MTAPLDSQPEPTVELDRLADELRDACGPVEMSSSFELDLQDRLQSNPWTLRVAMNNNRMLRVAAALLLVTTLGGPITALVMMFTPAPATTTEISMLPPQALPEIEEDLQPEPEAAIPPVDPSLEVAFGLDWQQAVQRSNRMAQVVGQWRAGRKDLRPEAASPSPALMDWANASLSQLAIEFQRRCTLDLSSPPPAGLALRIRELYSAAKQSEPSAIPNWLQAWAWILDGPGVKARQFF